jgi:hypothetical protein
MTEQNLEQRQPIVFLPLQQTTVSRDEYDPRLHGPALELTDAEYAARLAAWQQRREWL